jgi:hypothetical protein
MSKFLLGEKYRLELHWKKAVYEQEGICRLEGAYLSGPALKIAEKIRGRDSINLDFYRQYTIFVKHVYVAVLEWSDVIYNNDGTITLNDAVLAHGTELNRVPQFKNNDYIVIDTQKHEASTHHMHLVYESFVVNENGDLYKF